MGEHFKNEFNYCIPEDKEKISALLESYGVDVKLNSTMIGYGSYKEVHRTSIPGVVMLISFYKEKYQEELEIMKQLDSYQIPIAEHYTHEEIGPFIFILAKEYYGPGKDWGRDKINEVIETVKEFLHKISKKGFIVSDLQFLFDEDGSLVFHDPLSITPVSYYHSYGTRGVYFTAYCKHTTDGFWYPSDIFVRFEDVPE